MRPIHLTMQAFGPYAGCQVLPLDELGETGIYAITGETGAGKTTIFDAIVYALYGKGSGEDRSSADALRSAAADPKTETLVRLVFVSGGKTYTIERKPPQQLRGNKTKQAAKQALTLPDGRTLTRADDIAAAIEKDILGVTMDQFCQIVMIAQGEFRKLLKADTAERTKILRRIFRTEKYDKLREMFREASSQKYKELDRVRDSILFAMQSLDTAPDAPMADRLNAIKRCDAKAMYIESALALAADIAEYDRTAHQSAAAQLKTAVQTRDEAQAAYLAAEEQVKKHRQLADLQTTLVKQQQALQLAAEALQAAEAKQPEMEQLQNRIAADRALLPQYARLSSLTASHKQAKANQANAENDRTKAAANLTALKNAEAALLAEAQTLEGAADRKLQAATMQQLLLHTGKQLLDLHSRTQSRAAAEKQLTIAILRHEKAMQTEQAAAAKEAQLQTELEQLGNTALTVQTLLTQQTALTAQADEIALLTKLHQDYTQSIMVYNQAKERFAQQKDVAAHLLDAAHSLRSRYDDNIAGVLAADLQEGVPCRVCGSIHHPRLAQLTTDAPKLDDVKAAEQTAAEAQERTSTLAADAGSKKTAADALHDQLAQKLPDIAEAAWSDELRSRADANAAQQRSLNAQLAAAQTAHDRSQQLSSTEIPSAQHAHEEAAKALTAAASEVQIKQNDLSTAVSEVTKAAQTLMPEGWSDADLDNMIRENDNSAQRTAEAIRQAEKQIRRTEEIKTLLDQNRKDQQQQQSAAADAAAACEAAGVQAAAYAEQISHLTAELPYPTEDACSAAIESAVNLHRSMTDAITAARNQQQTTQTLIAGTKGQIDTLTAQLKGTAAPDLLAQQKLLEQAETVYAAASAAEKTAYARMQNNAHSTAALADQTQAARTLEAEYTMMQQLSDTAGGTVSGQAKVTLEAFVQAAYFDRIIRYANSRLHHMSRGQYDLVRQETVDAGKRSQTGLDLDVIDHYNGARRAVSTLSGGESFLAALSLALGMSDAIQASAASAVQLDTMFVDEGFGSLSENFLTLAMDELNDTAFSGHRLIGIISHIDEVKDSVGRRIEVTKGPSGVSTATIC